MITKDMKVGEVLRKYPKTRTLLMRYGICDCCGGHLTLEQGAKGKIDKLLNELNAVVG